MVFYGATQKNLRTLLNEAKEIAIKLGDFETAHEVRKIVNGLSPEEVELNDYILARIRLESGPSLLG
jgi:hypothetical protein